MIYDQFYGTAYANLHTCIKDDPDAEMQKWVHSAVTKIRKFKRLWVRVASQVFGRGGDRPIAPLESAPMREMTDIMFSYRTAALCFNTFSEVELSV